MKTLLIISLLLQNVNYLYASDNEKSLISEINRNWSYSPLYERKDLNSKIKIKLFQRLIWIGKTPIQAAQTNFTYLSNPKENVDLKKLSKLMIRSFPKGTLIARDVSNGIRLEGEWKQINRILKIDLIKKHNDFLAVTTFYRPSVARAFSKELEAFHSLLKSYDEEKIVKTSFLNFLINEATADEQRSDHTSVNLGDLLNGINPPGGTSGGATGGGLAGLTGADINTGMTNLGTGMTDLSTAISPLAPAIEHNASATDNLANAITVQGNQSNITALAISHESNESARQISHESNETARQISHETNETARQVSHETNQTALTISRETNATINRQGDAFNANYRESNRIAAMALDPNHMAKLAYYTAAGAALGSLTVNLAVEGIASGFSFLREFFTGEKEKAIDWDKFQKATSVWDSQVNSLVNYEKIVDDLISAFSFFQEQHLDNDYLSNLKKIKTEMKFEEKEMLALSEDKNLTKECRFKHYELADYLHNKVEDYEKILKLANEQHLRIDDNQKYFCQQLAELKQRILQAEQQMADLRLAILKAESQFYEKSSDNHEERQDKIEDINSHMARTLRSQEKFDKEASEQVDELNDKIRDEWIDKCTMAKNDEGKKIEEEKLHAMKIGDLHYLVYFSAKKKCKEKYKTVQKNMTRDSVAQENLISAIAIRKNLSVDANINVDIALSEEQQKWFTRMHMDAHCYQFAHGPDASLPKECKEFPEMLSSLRLSKGADKAQAAYKANCQSNYTDGLKKLASH